MNPAAPAQVTFGAALRYWLRLGLISFGGPAGQIAIMHRELVERRRWISERRFLHALNYCMVLPGPEAQQLATYIGWLLHGAKGGIAAGVLFVLPSLALLIALSWAYLAWGDSVWVSGLLYGVKPAVTAIVLFAAWRIARRSLRHPALWAIAAAAFAAIFVLHAPFPLIILAAAGIGAILGRRLPSAFSPPAAAAARHGAALIDDDTAPPPHARLSRKRTAAATAAGILLWLAAIALAAFAFGADSVPGRMAWFFTTAALLTFGGAYAVLPYVHQAAVQQYAWLSAPQMIDGLALGETTPGPLIIVVAFVGFVGGWQQQVLGPDALPAAGVLCAVVATFFTFLPSFLFILVGAPVVESTHGSLRFTAPLTAITAAVVGVILNLALFFAWHTFWPAGAGGPFEWPAAVLCAGAALYLFAADGGIVRTIAACAAAGFGYVLLG